MGEEKASLKEGEPPKGDYTCKMVVMAAQGWFPLSARVLRREDMCLVMRDFTFLLHYNL